METIECEQCGQVFSYDPDEAKIAVCEHCGWGNVVDCQVYVVKPDKVETKDA